MYIKGEKEVGRPLSYVYLYIHIYIYTYISEYIGGLVSDRNIDRIE